MCKVFAVGQSVMVHGRTSNSKTVRGSGTVEKMGEIYPDVVWVRMFDTISMTAMRVCIDVKDVTLDEPPESEVG